MKTTTATLVMVAALVRAAARDNACASILENHASEIVGGVDHHPQFAYYFRRTAEALVNELESNERELASYKCPKLLTEKQAAQVLSMVLA